MDEYTRAVPGQRLGKHVPLLGRKNLNNATVGLQQQQRNRGFFYVVRAEKL
jgi:hypothetical protein